MRLAPAGEGAETIDQLVPSHCSTTELIPPARYCPTAKQLVALAQETPSRLVDAAPAGFGLATIVQLVPSHCSTNVFVVDVPVADEPTAKQLVSLTHETPLRPDAVGLGLGTIDQLVPFHHSTSVRNGWLPALLPTAKQLVALTQDTSLNSVPTSPAGLGLGRTDQTVPVHRCTKDLFVEPVSEWPTAKQVELVGHETAFVPPVGGPSGLGLGDSRHTGSAPAAVSVTTIGPVTSAAATSTRTERGKRRYRDLGFPCPRRMRSPPPGHDMPQRPH